MDVSAYASAAVAALERMREDGYSKAYLKAADRVIRQFGEHCLAEGISCVDREAIEAFCDRKVESSAAKDKRRTWLALRKPLLVVIELHETGLYSRTHPEIAGPEVPEPMLATFALVTEGFIGQMSGLSDETLRLKASTAAKFLTYAAESGTTDLRLADTSLVDGFMESIASLAPTTLRATRGRLRELLDWLSSRGMVPFTGHEVFPVVRGCRGESLPSVYAADEVRAILSCIDTSTPQGKTDLAVMSLFAIAGLRLGDVASLNVSDIDWAARSMRITQRKTGRDLVVPLVDGILYPLADYVRNARQECPSDPDALFVTRRAPRRRMTGHSSYHKIVARCMGAAGVEPNGRHHGPHALRHSLAMAMLGDGAPVTSIADVLGHASVKSTEAYLSVNVEGSRALTLEVPR